MSVGDYFEIGMILAFGISWPINLIKAWRARTTRGTSLLFLFLIFLVIRGIYHLIVRAFKKYTQYKGRH